MIITDRNENEFSLSNDSIPDNVFQDMQKSLGMNLLKDVYSPKVYWKCIPNSM